MKRLMVFGAACMMLIAVSGCAKKVKRVGVEKVIDLSGKWNDTDSRLVSDEMMNDCLSRPWVTNHMAAAGGKIPAVIVGTVVNKTDEHIISETFTKDLERAMINSGRVQVVASSQERKEVREEREDMWENASEETLKQFQQEHAADYMLKGVINAIKDKEGKKSVTYYQIDLELINTETNQKVWLGNKKLKKYIKD
ncbi:MAG: penicillin-binding protein activator LpoB [Elusimicrobia bacterium]|nr:penicillin-binding protein activator LpoB [Elusimicrobiota bacterium]